ncbi:hypothetical protein GCM10023084_58680 [Streptomyces lacrimifluminis]|uniref:Uncharacterized protein n=1 Tax=Streptomyces lacrimifluminis TaxID=1500077 RepID=A0A917LBB3_9ACTN|nr:hypothetical protein GCM10012282_60920 [Streptomyces lacrimifluminis]
MTADDSYNRLGDDYPGYTMARAAELLGTTEASSAPSAKPASSPRCAPPADTGAAPATSCTSQPEPANSSTTGPPSTPPAASSFSKESRAAAEWTAREAQFLGLPLKLVQVWEPVPDRISESIPAIATEGNAQLRATSRRMTCMGTLDSG